MLTLLLRSRHLVMLRSAQRVKWLALGRTRFGLNHGTSAFSSPLSSAIYNSLHNPSAPVFSVWFSSPSTSKTFPLLLSHCCARGVAQHHIKAAIFCRMISGLPNFVFLYENHVGCFRYISLNTVISHNFRLKIFEWIL